jgi:hypothetical protein
MSSGEFRSGRAVAAPPPNGTFRFRSRFPRIVTGRRDKMANAQVKKRGGDADGPVSRPKDASQNPQQRVLDQEVDDTFPASDPPASTQPVGKEPPPPKPRHAD